MGGSKEMPVREESLALIQNLNCCGHKLLAGSGSNKQGDKEKMKSKGKSPKLSTDPQSVAARERRHRISARFKILQSMVPGGAKMDTVAVLEEAIQYVKFLKAQISWLNHQHQSQNQNQNQSGMVDLYYNNASPPALAVQTLSMPAAACYPRGLHPMSSQPLGTAVFPHNYYC